MYLRKAQTYVDLKNWIINHKNYSTTNEWACHELTALFYEIVLISKDLISSRSLSHNNHYSTIKSLEKIDLRLSDAYRMLLTLSRKFRYEAIRISKRDRNDFLMLYSKFKTLVQSL